MAEIDFVPGLFIRDDDEGLFSRDIDGQLVRLDAPTEADYDKQVTLQIDGQPVTVPMAEPLTDSEGNIVLDIGGRTTPRYTTIYDAATKLYVKEAGDQVKIPIPILCHQPHMRPVAVCRLCVVQIYGQKRGKRAAERKLLPACQHQVKDGMEVFTMKAPGPDGDRVRQTVKVMTELLAVDHLRPVDPSNPLARELEPYNELGQMVHRCEAKPERFQLDVLANPPPVAKPLAGQRQFDASSPVFLVDHSACILCDRCVRACDEVMENHVIGRTGKGANAGIGFDFNEPMGSSSCVKCGECMVSCPTSAITFKPVAQIKLKAGRGSAEALPASELLSDPTFFGIPPKFLLWQKGLVVRRRVKKGDVLCRQGDPGNTAFLIKSGKLDVTVYPSATSKSWHGRGAPVFEVSLTSADLIAGEMSCLSGSARAGDVTVLEAGEIWEIRRNILDRMMRLPQQRERFEAEYRDRSLELILQQTELFKGISPDEYIHIVNYLRERLSFVRTRPGQTLFEQGDTVTDMYLVRLGHVRVGVRRFKKEAKVLSCGPGAVVGEIGLLGFTPEDVAKTADRAEEDLMAALERGGDDLEARFPAGTRMATCSALGHLELARLSRGDFLEMIRLFPQLRKRMVQQSLARMRSGMGSGLVEKFVEHGLYEGTNILVLDLDLCTRCDECTRGCVDKHGNKSHGVPVTRLLRDGIHFGHFTVATSCRSCMQPHCMAGCPVDAIHRGKHLQIVIEDHCIGCGLCASNCPYGSIFMVPNQHHLIDTPHPEIMGEILTVAQPKAATCDLCDAEGNRSSPEPRCVSSCPHDAAHRMTGEELLLRALAN